MTEAIVAVVTHVDDGVPPEVLASILSEHARGPTGRCRLAEELRDHPERLTRDDPHTSALLARVTSDLVAAGHSMFVQPTCPSCGRARTYAYPTGDGARICQSCRPPHTEVCAGCGEVRRVARRGADGLAACSTCCSNDSSRFEMCVLCGRARRVAIRDKLGRPFCHPCHKAQRPDRTGRWIGNREQRRQAREAAVLDLAEVDLPGIDPTVITACARIDGQPYCHDCRPRKARDCPRCGQLRVCHRVLIPEKQRVFGQEFTQLLCGPCLARQRLESLMRVGDQPIAPHWQPLIETMLASPDSQTLLEWIQTRSAAKVLHELAQQPAPPTHADLDRMSLTTRQAVEQVRALLESAGLLDHQDTRRHRLAHRLEARIENDCPPEDRLLVRSYVQWAFLPALERSARRAKRPIYPHRASEVGAVIAYLRHLRANGLSLQAAHQGAFDAWIVRHRSHLHPLREFLRWAQRHGHSSRIQIPQRSRKDAIEFISDDQRRAAITAALAGSGTPRSDEDRLAVLLLLLYGQGPTQIVSLTDQHLSIQPDGTVHLRLGRDPVQLVEPVAALALRLRGRSMPTAALRDVPTKWLFPGHSPGRPLHPTTLSRRLKVLGVPARAGHNSTLLDLSRHSAPAVLADLLGLHPSTVEAWSNAAGSRWASYASSKTTPHQHGPSTLTP